MNASNTYKFFVDAGQNSDSRELMERIGGLTCPGNGRLVVCEGVCRTAPRVLT
jgi:hypothetical protein